MFNIFKEKLLSLAMNMQFVSRLRAFGCQSAYNANLKNLSENKVFFKSR